MTDKGDLVAGRYRLVGRIGRGAMGVVWRAHDERLDRTVAVKLLSFDATADDNVFREARLAARIQHPNAIQVHDVVDHDGRPCLVMEYLPSSSLSAVLTDRGALPADEVAAIGAQIAGALTAAHDAGIVHRDIKPDNVLIAPDGTVKITDFGISRLIGDGAGTATGNGVIAGTPAYLAPEVATGGKAGFPSDVYSLGSTLYTATEGAPPYGFDENPIVLVRRVATGEIAAPRQSGVLGPLLLWLLRADPSERPSMREAQEYLVSGKLPPEAQPRTATMALPPRKPRRRSLLLTAAAAALVALGIVVGLAINRDGGPAALPLQSLPAATTTSHTPLSSCQADYQITNSWQDGYEVLVTIRSGTAARLNGWTVTWMLPGGQSINNLWNGTLSLDGANVRVAPAQWNTAVDSTTSFGFIAATRGAGPVKPDVVCTAQ
ncbi:hypothetical protein ALI144C_01040 [Actinosynnema sp. ALI-1.44]|uniref:serine/threonine-protein kinase n=1 Tax=Actinosynnema sp. ALI-1.44 TaxID=1933779 RepID=UPI00097C0A7A|nr:serine/threonine-protein kinase [Actinosynnema sp. ALI-1.44]ONI91499.1 hypothetical protein ALI144C_01040 [Actinosynnema sp. ALI-1.44]